jgi:hypothetical protein
MNRILRRLRGTAKSASILGVVVAEGDARQCIQGSALWYILPDYFDDVISRTTSCIRARYRPWLGSMREAISSSPSASS